MTARKYGYRYGIPIPDVTNLGQIQDAKNHDIVYMLSPGSSVNDGVDKYELDRSSTDTYSLVPGVVVAAHASLGGNWLRRGAFISYIPSSHFLELTNVPQDDPTWADMDFTTLLPEHAKSIVIRAAYENNKGSRFVYFRPKGTTQVYEQLFQLHNVEKNKMTWADIEFSFTLGNEGIIQRKITTGETGNDNNLIVNMIGYRT